MGAVALYKYTSTIEATVRTKPKGTNTPWHEEPDPNGSEPMVLRPRGLTYGGGMSGAVRRTRKTQGGKYATDKQ
jgi:hypothetical protein